MSPPTKDDVLHALELVRCLDRGDQAGADALTAGRDPRRIADGLLVLAGVLAELQARATGQSADQVLDNITREATRPHPPGRPTDAR